MAGRDKVSFPPPFSPQKGKGGGVIAMDPAFEFEAPMYCELQDDTYDFYEDYEKNIWFQTTHWLHEPPEKRPVDRSKRKSVSSSLAAAALAAKRQLAALSGDSPVKRPTRGGDYEARKSGDRQALSSDSPAKRPTRGESRKSGDAFEQDSPSRVFAPLDNADEPAKRRAGLAASPASKLLKPKRVSRDESNKENILCFDELEEKDNISKPKSRKSVMPRTSSEGKLKQPEVKRSGSNGRTSDDALVKDDKQKTITKSRISGGKDSATTVKSDAGDGTVKRVSGERGTRVVVSKVAETWKEKKSSAKEGEVASNKVVQKSKSETDLAKRKASSEDPASQSTEPAQAKLKARKSIFPGSSSSTESKPSESTVTSSQTTKLKARKSIFTSATATESKIASSQATEADNPPSQPISKVKPRRSISTTASRPTITHTTSSSDLTSEKSAKPKPRKSVAASGLSFLNTYSTSITTNIPSKVLLPPSPTHSSTKDALQSTIPLLDNLKCVTALPTRVLADEDDESNELVEDRQQDDREEANEKAKETEKEKQKEQLRKRKSVVEAASDKPKRVRSSIMTCPVPAKKPAAPAEIPAAAKVTATKTNTTKRKAIEFDLDDDVAAMLEKHNKKFKPVAAYVPRNFSTKDVKMYEEVSGKKWYSLTAAEREEANEWIKQMKAQM